MIKFFKTIWEGWKKVAKVIGKVNSVILLTLVYFIIIGPVILVRKFFLLFKSKKEKTDSYWQNYQNLSADDFKRQF